MRLFLQLRLRLGVVRWGPAGSGEWEVGEGLIVACPAAVAKSITALTLNVRHERSQGADAGMSVLGELQGNARMN